MSWSDSDTDDFANQFQLAAIETPSSPRPADSRLADNPNEADMLLGSPLSDLLQETPLALADFEDSPVFMRRRRSTSIDRRHIRTRGEHNKPKSSKAYSVAKRLDVDTLQDIEAERDVNVKKNGSQGVDCKQKLFKVIDARLSPASPEGRRVDRRETIVSVQHRHVRSNPMDKCPTVSLGDFGGSFERPNRKDMARRISANNVREAMDIGTDCEYNTEHRVARGDPFQMVDVRLSDQECGGISATPSSQEECLRETSYNIDQADGAGREHDASWVAEGSSLYSKGTCSGLPPSTRLQTSPFDFFDSHYQSTHTAMCEEEVLAPDLVMEEGSPSSPQTRKVSFDDWIDANYKPAHATPREEQGSDAHRVMKEVSPSLTAQLTSPFDCVDSHYKSTQVEVCDWEQPDAPFVMTEAPPDVHRVMRGVSSSLGTQLTSPFDCVDSHYKSKQLEVCHWEQPDVPSVDAPIFRKDHKAGHAPLGNMGDLIDSDWATRIRESIDSLPLAKRQRRNECEDGAQERSKSECVIQGVTSDASESLPQHTQASMSLKVKSSSPTKPDVIKRAQSWTLRLSSEQLVAVQSPLDQPLLVLAGPGSGKTFFLVSRILRALDEGISSESIVAVTYTRQAAKELGQRLRGAVSHSLSNPTGSIPWVGTVHALALRFLRESIVGNATAAPRVASEEQRRAVVASELNGALQELTHLGLLKTLPTEDSGDEDESDGLEFEGAELGGNSSSCNGRKNHERIAALVRIFRQIKERPSKWQSALQEYPVLDTALATYNKVMRKHGLLDIDGILPAAIDALGSNGESSRWAQSHAQHIFVDEWQDVDGEQVDFLKKMCCSLAVTAVGDDDQQIYEWRRNRKPGASIDATPIECFREYWPSAKIVTLGENFRSLPRIVEVADKLITHNVRRMPKHLRSARAMDTKTVDRCVRVVIKDNVDAEMQWVAEEIRRLRIEAAPVMRPWESFVILGRTNTIVQAMETQLMRLDIPAQPPKGKHKSAREVLDLIAYLRLVIDEHHDDSFLRIFNTPKRGLGKASLRCLRERFRAPAETKKSMHSNLKPLTEINPTMVGVATQKVASSTMSQAVNGRPRSYMSSVQMLLATPLGIKPKMVQGFAGLNNILLSARSEAQNRCSAADVARALLRSTGQETSIELERMLAVASRYVPSEGLPTGAACVAQFLRDGAGLAETTSKGHVCVSTVHAAKGLEWDTVFVVQCSATVFPLGQDLEAQNDARTMGVLQEERRLFYVAMTRARSELVLTCPLRLASGTLVNPSRFLVEAGLLSSTFESTGQQEQDAFAAGQSGLQNSTSGKQMTWSDLSEVLFEAGLKTSDAQKPITDEFAPSLGSDNHNAKEMGLDFEANASSDLWDWWPGRTAQASCKEASRIQAAMSSAPPRAEPSQARSARSFYGSLGEQTLGLQNQLQGLHSTQGGMMQKLINDQPLRCNDSVGAMASKQQARPSGVPSWSWQSPESQEHPNPINYQVPPTLLNMVQQETTQLAQQSQQIRTPQRIQQTTPQLPRQPHQVLQPQRLQQQTSQLQQQLRALQPQRAQLTTPTIPQQPPRPQRTQQTTPHLSQQPPEPQRTQHTTPQLPQQPQQAPQPQRSQQKTPRLPQQPQQALQPRLTQQPQQPQQVLQPQRTQQPQRQQLCEVVHECDKQKLLSDSCAAAQAPHFEVQRIPESETDLLCFEQSVSSCETPRSAGSLPKWKSRAAEAEDALCRELFGM